MKTSMPIHETVLNKSMKKIIELEKELCVNPSDCFIAIIDERDGTKISVTRRRDSKTKTGFVSYKEV